MPPDLVRSDFLHEPGILHTLRVRYALDSIYTYSGNILIAVGGRAGGVQGRVQGRVQGWGATAGWACECGAGLLPGLCGVLGRVGGRDGWGGVGSGGKAAAPPQRRRLARAVAVRTLLRGCGDEMQARRASGEATRQGGAGRGEGARERASSSGRRL